MKLGPRFQLALQILVLAALAGIGTARDARGAIHEKAVFLSGLQENPAVISTGFGGGSVIIDTDANTLSYRLAYGALSAAETAAHIHGPADPGVNAGVLVNLPAGNPKIGVWVYPEAREADILAGRMYVNIHTTTNPGGEIRGQIMDEAAYLDGRQEVPQNATTGTGVGVFKIDTTSNQLSYFIRSNGLSGAETAAHIHGVALHGVNAGVIHPLPAGNPKIGVYNYPEAMEEAILSGRTYVNLHTAAFPGGEIRGQIVPIVVPVERTQEVPPTASTGAAVGMIAWDVGTHVLSYDIRSTGLSGTETAAHIHGFAPPGVNAGVLHTLPAGPRKLGAWPYGAASEAQVLDGLTYINIHTNTNPGGDIRGQIDGFEVELIDEECGDCGPGAHWMDNPPCPTAVDNMPSSALVRIDTDLDGVMDATLAMTGPVQVRRSNPLDDSNQYPGTRPVDGHMDVIDTEIISMSLTGGGATLRGGAGMGAIPLAPTRGSIAEDHGNPSLSECFMDVFFEVDLGGGNRLYNQAPLRLDSIIDCVSPHATLESAGIILPLYTSPNPGQGVHAADLLTTRHTTFPQPGACCIGTVCQVMTADECEVQGGFFQGENVSCTPDPCVPPNPCADCGPGPHWIDSPLCPAGSDNMPSGVLVGLDTNLDCVRDVNLVMTGPVQVVRTNPIDDSSQYPGTRPVDGHRDVIDTEIVSMSLTGSGAVLTAGAGMGGMPLDASLGAIAEQPGNPNLADSFFDVFFEVDLGGGNRLYNQTPMRINSVIDCVPPQAIYAHPNICIPLYSSPTPGQGVHVANLVTANHTTFPRPGACCLGPNCVLLTANECEAQGGVFQGEDTPCDPNPCGTSEPCADCGPGPHWIHNPFCPPGTDNMPSGAVVGVDTNLDCVRDVNLVLFGPVNVNRSGPMDDSGNYPGTRPIDGHQDVIDTEIISMSLTGGGATLVAGAGQGAIPLLPTRGAIAEQPAPNSHAADSFFDVFFEVDLGGGNRVYNQAPLRLDSVINCVPPNSIYAHPNICIPLYTSPNPGQGVHVANLVSANHTPFLDPVTAIDDTAPAPLGAPTLLGNVPNPVHSQTTIRFHATSAGDVTLEIFDATGRVVRKIEDQVLGVGSHGVIWDGLDGQGRPVPTGIYEYRVRLGAEALKGKLTVIR